MFRCLAVSVLAISAADVDHIEDGCVLQVVEVREAAMELTETSSQSDDSTADEKAGNPDTTKKWFSAQMEKRFGSLPTRAKVQLSETAEEKVESQSDDSIADLPRFGSLPMPDHGRAKMQLSETSEEKVERQSDDSIADLPRFGSLPMPDHGRAKMQLSETSEENVESQSDDSIADEKAGNTDTKKKWFPWQMGEKSGSLPMPDHAAEAGHSMRAQVQLSETAEENVDHINIEETPETLLALKIVDTEHRPTVLPLTVAGKIVDNNGGPWDNKMSSNKRKIVDTEHLKEGPLDTDSRPTVQQAHWMHG